MTTYYITILIVSIFALIAQNNIIKSTSINDNKVTMPKPPMTKMFFVIASAVLIFVAGFRYYVGTDYGSYYFGFSDYVSRFSKDLVNLDEPGYSFICWIVSMLELDSAAAIFVASAITNILFLVTVYKNTDMLLPATLLYVFLGCWHGAFNGVRQYLAAAIVFAGLRFIKERKFWKYALVVFIAFLFHSSAVLMIFPYFIAYNKISLRNILFLVIGSIVILFSFSEIVEFTSVLLREDLTDEGEYLTNSVNVLRILVAIAPAVFFLFVYHGKTITKEQQFWFNMLIINGIVMLATSNSTYLARMGIYTAPFSVIGIPELINGLSKKDKKLVTTIVIILFFAFWLYEISISSSLNNFRFVFNK